MTAANVEFLHVYFSAKATDFKTRPRVPAEKSSTGHRNIWWAPKYPGYRIRYHDGEAWRQHVVKINDGRTKKEALQEAAAFKAENCKADETD